MNVFGTKHSQSIKRSGTSIIRKPNNWVTERTGKIIKDVRRIQRRETRLKLCRNWEQFQFTWWHIFVYVRRVSQNCVHTCHEIGRNKAYISKFIFFSLNSSHFPFHDKILVQHFYNFVDCICVLNVLSCCFMIFSVICQKNNYYWRHHFSFWKFDLFSDK